MNEGVARLPPLAVGEPERALLRRIVGRIVPDAEVWVFGSRATGRARPLSDLDLLFTHPAALSWQQRADLRDAFEASTLPFRVDGVEAAAPAPGMRGRVGAERQLLIARGPERRSA
jgi:predicted nucleotidyltransferase